MLRINVVCHSTIYKWHNLSSTVNVRKCPEIPLGKLSVSLLTRGFTLKKIKTEKNRRNTGQLPLDFLMVQGIGWSLLGFKEVKFNQIMLCLCGCLAIEEKRWKPKRCKREKKHKSLKKKQNGGDPKKKKLGENTTFWRGICINECIFGHLYFHTYSYDTEFIQAKDHS